MCWDFCVFFWLERLAETHGWGLKPPFLFGFPKSDFLETIFVIVFFTIFELEKSRIFAKERSSFWRVPFSTSNRMILWETYFWWFPHEDFPRASYGAKVLKNERPRSTIEQWKKCPWMFRVYRGIYCPVRWGLSKTIIRIPIQESVFHGK